jgi:hypothetical protein
LGIGWHDADNLPLATFYFAKAAELKHPVGFYMLALSLRHGWGCKEDQEGAVALLKRSIASTLSSLSILSQRIPLEVMTSDSPESLPLIELDLPVEQMNESKDQSAPTSFTPKESLPVFERESSAYSIGLVSRLSEISLRATDNPEGSLADDVHIVKNLLPLPLYELGNCYRFGWGVKKSLRTSARLYTFSARLGDLESQLTLTHLYANEGSRICRSKSTIAFWLRQAEREGWSTFNENWIWKKKYDPKPDVKEERLLTGVIDADADMIVEMLDEYRTLFHHEDETKRSDILQKIKSYLCIFSACSK